MSQTVAIQVPVTADDVASISHAPRVAGLQGQRVGLVDNSKLNANMFIDRICERLSEAGAEIGCRVRKLAPKDPLGAEDVAQLGQCDAVIQCYGDCGTSTSVSVADAVRLERAGVPTTTVFSTAFSGAAQYQALGHGLAGLPMVEIPHPMHSAAAASVLERADAAFDRIVASLTDADRIPIPNATRVPAALASGAEAGEQEEFFEQGWTDGLPVVVPTFRKVEEMLAAAGRDRDEIVGQIPPNMRPATVEKIAVNAVMAGCRPEYFAIVLAAVDAMLDKDADLYGAQTATNMSSPLLVLNGPIASKIGANSGRNVLGSGNRANMTIGRAIRLVCRNIGGELADKTDMATHGQPGKISFCLAEAEDESPWSTFASDLGMPAGENVVTVLAGASSPHNIFTYGCENGELILDHFVGAVSALGHNNIIFPSGPLFIVGPEHANVLARDGFSKDDIRRYVFEKARLPMSRFGERTAQGLRHRRSNWFETVGDPEHIGVADRPEDVHIVVAGGPGIHSLFVPTSFSLRPIARRIAGV